MSYTGVSTLNRIRAATLTASSSASGFSVDQLKEPEHVGITWRSIGTGDAWVVINLGSAIPLPIIGAMRCNFRNFTIAQHTSDTWGAPAFGPVALTTELDFEGIAYRRWYESASLTRQFTRIFIPSQVPVDGANYFEIAGLWAGPFTNLPIGNQPGYESEIVDPRDVRQADLGGWTKVIRTGETHVIHRWRRQAGKTPTAPGVSDEYRAWADLDRAIRVASFAGLFCYVIRIWGPGAIYCVRQLPNTTWLDGGLVVANDTWELTEAVAG
jgi:hypothetical protein